MNVNESIIEIIKWEIMKILVSEIHTIFFMKTGKPQNENIQIPLSLTIVSQCKMNEKYDRKVIFNE